MGDRRQPCILIVVENLPAQRDPRVRRECEALLAAGYRVAVISPRPRQPSPGLAGVALYQYPAPREVESTLGFAYEFAYSWVMTLVLAAWAFARERFAVLQACNPPDTYFALALPFKLVGTRFVFDHHDLAPELYTARFGRSSGAVFRALHMLERATLRTADHVISTNESFAKVARERGGRSDSDITVVRNGPRLADLVERPPRPALKHGRAHLVCWLGVMGAVDDGVDIALEAVRAFVAEGRDDCHFAFVGDGEARVDMQALATQLGIDAYVSFPGWLERDGVLDYLATADLGLQPDPKSPRTDVSTAVKTMEYMGAGVPVVAFDVDETRRSAGDAGAYAEPNDPKALAALIAELLDDPRRRASMGEHGQRRVRERLAWDHQQRGYVAVFDRVLEQAKGGRMTRRGGHSARSRHVRRHDAPPV